jgi:hypothetical protein
MSSMYRSGITKALNSGANDISVWSGRVSAVGDTLESVCQLYVATEVSMQNQRLAELIGPVMPNKDFFTILGPGTYDIWDHLWQSVRDGFVEESSLNLIAGILEGSGSAAGLINMLTAKAFMPGNAGFYMLNESVLPFTSWLSKIAPKLATAGKYGIPVLGGVLDFISQLQDGEQALHAGIKAGVHTGIGIGTGAAVGALIGSIVPVAGTAAGAATGAVIGLIAQVAISSVATIGINSGFDYVYDEYLREPIDQAAGWVGDRIKDIGEGINSFFSGAGKMLGTVFG